MGANPLGRRLLAEFVGTGLLVAAVVGSGIAAVRLSPGNIGLELLENTAATIRAYLHAQHTCHRQHPGRRLDRLGPRSPLTR